MMLQRRLLLLALALAALTGCLPAEPTSVRQTEITAPARLAQQAAFDIDTLVGQPEGAEFTWIRQLGFSPQGEHLLVLASTRRPWLEGHPRPPAIFYLLLFNAPEARLEARVRLNDLLEGGVRRFYASFLDEQHYYVADENELLVFRFGLDEPVARHPGDHGNTLSNQSYIAHYFSLFDWRSGKTYPVRAGTLDVSDLTASGWVVSAERNDYVILHQPLHDQLLGWDSGFHNPRPFVTASEQHLVAYGDSGLFSRRTGCRVWRIANQTLLGRCRRPQGEGGDAAQGYAAHPTQDRFALYWGQRIQVYEAEPFQPLATLELDGDVLHMAFAGEERLVVITEHDVQLWDLQEPRLLAAAKEVGPHLSLRRYGEPGAVQFVNPNGRQIVTVRSDDGKSVMLTFYAIPE